MRVLMIVPGGVDQPGEYRVIPALHALIARIARQHELTVAALRQSPEEAHSELLGASIVNLGYGARRFPAHQLLTWQHRLKRYLDARRNPIDLVHAAWIGPTSTLALGIARRYRIPSVVSLLGGELVAIPEIGYGGRLSWSMRIHERLAFHFATRMTAPSQFAMLPIRCVRPDACVLALMPDVRSFLEIDRPEKEATLRLLTVSTVNRVKDPLTLLRAFRRVVEHREDIHLDWVGEDILDGLAQREAERLGIARHVTFHGFQPYQALPGFYGHAHVYVQASRFESAGVAVCEAAAAGMAIVGTRTGFLAEMPSECAVTVMPGLADDLGEAILKVLQNPDLRRTMGQCARQWVMTRTADQTFEQCQSVYAAAVEAFR